MTLSVMLLAAAAFADLAALDRQVAEFTGVPAGAINGAAMPLDRRLRLKPCGSPAALSWRGSRRETIVVECPDVGGWRLFVPVRAAPVPVSSMAGDSAAVRRGDAVSIAVTGDGFSIGQTGEALEGGAIGEWIRVRPASSKSGGDIMRAQVIRAGLVGVPLP